VETSGIGRSVASNEIGEEEDGTVNWPERRPKGESHNRGSNKS